MSVVEGRHYQTNEALKVSIRQGTIESVVRIDVSSQELPQLPIIAPGLFDIQVNGYRGTWFSSPSLTIDEVVAVIEAYVERGITRCLPTLITSSNEAIEHGLTTLKAARQKSEIVRRVVCGYHIEGPYISAVDGPRGAHPLRHVRPASIGEFRRWQQAAGGLIRLITIAPEAEGAMEFIRTASQGTVVAIGHSAATSHQIGEAITAGARLGTHLGNGCQGMINRHDNVFWPQLADDRLTCSVIADGWHVPKAMLNCIVRCKSLERVVLTCDVSGFGGCSPGRYVTDDMAVDVLDDGRIVVAGQTQFLAGSGATTGECVAHLVNTCDVSLGDAWQCASTRPAKLLGLPSAEIVEGSAAYLTLFRLEETPSCKLRYVPVKAIAGR